MFSTDEVWNKFLYITNQFSHVSILLCDLGDAIGYIFQWKQWTLVISNFADFVIMEVLGGVITELQL